MNKETPESFIRKLTGKKTGFPGAMAINVDFSKKLNWDDYLITNKLDGERFLLFGFDGNGYRMNRKCIIEKLSFLIPNGTVIDTEYYNELYHIIDFIAESGQLKKDSFSNRIKQVKDLILPKEIIFKHFLKISKKNIEYLKKELKKVYLQEFEGYIFVEKKSKISFKTTSSILKWKLFELNTVDFLYDDGELKVKTSKGLVVKGNSFFQNYINGILIENGNIIECKPVILDGKINWIPYRFRYDKSDPNFITVYNNVIQTIKEFQPIEKLLNI